MNKTSSESLKEKVGRRTFLKVIGSATPAIAVSACSPIPPEKIIPYVIPPEDVIPGVSTWYATVCGECPSGCGALVRTREGRAVKVEGNPKHPINGGALCIRGQASLQGLYNPDRFQEPQKRKTTNAKTGQSVVEPVNWDDAQQVLIEKVRALHDAGKSDRIAVVTPLMSGTLDLLVGQWGSAVGGARRFSYEPFSYEAIRAANGVVFNRDTIPNYDFSAAELVVSFGADFLETWLSTVGYTQAHTKGRRVRDGQKARFVQFESRLSLTASSADEWISIEPGTEGLIASAMVHTIISEQRVQVDSITDDEIQRIASLVSGLSADAVSARVGIPADRIVELARAFSDPSIGSGRTLAVGGGVAASGANATSAQVAITLLNYVAGNVGSTINFFSDSIWDGLNTYRDMLELSDAMRSGEIELLILHNVNPVHTLPAAIDFSSAMSAVPFVVAMSSFPDETTARADLVLPMHTPFESWGDHDSGNGLLGLMQPTMRPVYDTRHFGDVLLDVGRAVVSENGTANNDVSVWPEGNFYEFLRQSWQSLHQSVSVANQTPADDSTNLSFEEFWAASLRRGGYWHINDSEQVLLNEAIDEISLDIVVDSTTRTLSLITYPSLHFYDGRGANRPWLQEIPDPLLKTAWGSCVELSPETALSLGAEDGQLVVLESDYGSSNATVVVTPQIRSGVVAIPIGQGHTDFGRYATGRGVNPMALLNPEPEVHSGGVRWVGTRLDVKPLDVRRPIPRLQNTFDQHDRDLVRSIPLAALAAENENSEEPHFSLYPEHAHPDHRWGMAIDLDSCNGCNACVAACYAENNIPVVGAEQTLRGRTMSWMRIERFVEPDAVNGNENSNRFLPMLCQHCDQAPCETVCPVYATYHTEEGLNAQVYNRCVGTRYCANNCPYKVRRFNWSESEFPEPLHLQLNPDVTARSAGVMEKCTFCVQRIQGGKEQAKDEGRPMRDGDVTPACAQTCPAQAIVFGDLNDPNSQVSQLSANSRGYHVLSAANTRPAVTYLKKITQT